MWKWLTSWITSLFAKNSKPKPVTPTPDAGSGAGGATNSVPSGGTGEVPSTPSEYAIAAVTASAIYWTGPDLDWPERNGCCGESHLYRADGRGGKFDHFRRNSKSRDWKNVHGGYGIFGTIGEPANGERCRLELVSYDGKQRVTVGTFNWKA